MGIGTRVAAAYIEVTADIDRFEKQLATRGRALARSFARDFGDGIETHIGKELDSRWESIMRSFATKDKLDLNDMVTQFRGLDDGTLGRINAQLDDMYEAGKFASPEIRDLRSHLEGMEFQGKDDILDGLRKMARGARLSDGEMSNLFRTIRGAEDLDFDAMPDLEDMLERANDSADEIPRTFQRIKREIDDSVDGLAKAEKHAKTFRGITERVTLKDQADNSERMADEMERFALALKKGDPDSFVRSFRDTDEARASIARIRQELIDTDGYAESTANKMTGSFRRVADEMDFADKKTFAFSKSMERVKKLRMDRDFDQLARALDSMDWDEWVRSSGGIEKARARLERTTTTLRDMGHVYGINKKTQDEATKSFEEYAKAVQDADRDSKSYEATVRKIKKHRLDRDMRSIADAMDSADWKKWVRESGGIDKAGERLVRVTGKMRDLDMVSDETLEGINKSFGDAAESMRAAEKDARSFETRMERIKRLSLDKDMTELGRAMDKADWGKWVKDSGGIDQANDRLTRVTGEMRRLDIASDETLRKMRTSFDDAAKSMREAERDSKKFETVMGRMRSQRYDRDFDMLARSVDSVDWSSWTRGAKNLDDARTNVVKVTEELRKSGRLTRDNVHEIHRSFDIYARQVRTTNKDVDRHGRLIGLIRKGVDKVRLSWARMDRTVKLVLTLILAAGDQVASLVVGIVGALGAIVSSAGMAVAAVVPLGAALAPTAYGFFLMKESITQLKDAGGPAAKAMERLGDAFKKVDVPAFTEGFEKPFTNMVNTLAKSLEDETIGTALGKSMGSIMDAFTGVLESGAWKMFVEAMQTTLPAAMGAFGRGSASVFEGLLTVMATLSPLTQQMGESFEKWGRSFADAMTASSESGGMITFFTQAEASLRTLLDFAGSLGSALGQMFYLGSFEGNKMLDVLTGLLDRWKEWMKTSEGAEATTRFFSDARRIFEALYPLVGALAVGIRDMVTPDAIDRFEKLSLTLAEFVPYLSDALHTIGQLGILNLIAEAFLMVGKAIEPLLPSLGELFGLIYRVVSGVMVTLTPILQEVATALSPLIDGITTLGNAVLPSFLNALDKVTVALTPFIQALGALFGWVNDKIVPVLIDGLVWAFDKVAVAAEWLSDLFTGMGDKFNPLVGTITALAVAFLGFSKISALVAGVGGLAAAFGRLAGPLSKVLGPFTRLWPLLTAHPLFAIIGAVAGLVAVFLGAGGSVDDFGKMFEGMADKIRGFAEMIPGIVDGIVSALPAIIDTIVGALTTALGAIADIIPKILPPILEAFTSIVGAIATIIPALIPPLLDAAVTLFTALVQAVGLILPPLIEALSGVIQAIVEAIPVILPVLLEAGVMLFHALVQAIPLVLPVIIEGIVGLITMIAEILPTLIGTLLEAAVTLFTALVQAVPLILPQIVEAFQHLIETLIGMLPVLLPMLLNAGITLFSAMVDAIGQVLPVVIQGVLDLITAVADAIPTLIPAILDAAVTLFLAIVEAIPVIIPILIDAVVGLIISVSEKLPSLIGTILNAGVQLFMGLVKAIPMVLGALLRAVGSLGSAIVRGIIQIVPAMLRAGANIIGGLLKGIWSMAGSVVKAVSNIASSAYKAITSFFGIRSPSRLMERVGRYLDDGLIIGLEKGEDGVEKQATSLSERVLGAFSRENMVATGKTAADALAEGLEKNVSGAQAALNGLTVPNLSLSAAQATRRQGDAAVAAAAGKTVVIEEGAFNVQSNATQPEVVAEQVFDRLASALG